MQECRHNPVTLLYLESAALIYPNTVEIKKTALSVNWIYLNSVIVLSTSCFIFIQWFGLFISWALIVSQP